MVDLRPYQVSAIAETRGHVAAGRRAALIVAPCGAGKTTIGADIVRSHIARNPNNRVAWLAHRRELIEQAADRLRSFGLRVGCAGLDPGAPVQVSSVQTILARGDAPEATLVIPDEAHHCVSDEWKRVFLAYKASGAILVGLTATPERDDGRPLSEVFDALVVATQIGELIDQKYLVPCEILAPTRTVPKGKIAEDPHVAYARVCPGAHAVCFAPHVKAANDYADGFRKSGVTVGVIHGAMATAERDATLRAFRESSIRVLCNVMVLTEGWDAPVASVVILARRIGACSLYLQMGGRVLRPYPGKERALMIDLTGVSKLHGPLEEERIFSLDGKIRRKGESATQRYCATCGAPINDAFCEMCGPSGGELETPIGAGIALEKFAWAKHVTDDKRVLYLARWYAQALGRRHRPDSAHHKYKAVFKEWPPAKVQLEARRMAG